MDTMDAIYNQHKHKMYDYRAHQFIQCIVSLRKLPKAVFNTLRPRQNDRHFPDDIFKCIFLVENVHISIKILLKFVPKGPISKFQHWFR